jgi:hypothetical protein
MTGSSCKGLVDFSGLTLHRVARFNKIVQNHDFSESIEMLDAFRYVKIDQPSGRSSK